MAYYRTYIRMFPRTVGSVMETRMETVTAKTPARTVADQLREPGVESLVECGSVVSIVTASDIVALVGERVDYGAPAWTFMSAPVVTASPADDLLDAAATMRETGVRRLPVLDGNALVGTIKVTGLARHLPEYRLDVEWKGVPLEQRRKALPFAD